jgi:dimethylglycine dehydrogenase
MSAFAKALVTGPGAREWLESIFANAIPKKRGRIALCHMLTKEGGVRSEFTVYESAPGTFYLVSAGAYEAHDHDYMRKLLPADGSVKFTPITQAWGVLVLAGPKSRDVLKKLTRTSLDNKDFPWLSGKEISIGAASAHALRVNFVGELGWELHHPIEMQNYIFDKLMEAGAEFGIKPFGIRAMLSMSVEKSYRLIPREMSIEYNAYESGLDRFIKPEKQFLGRDGLLAYKEKGLKWNFATLVVETGNDVDARGSEAIYNEAGELVGRATNGTFGFRINRSLALAMLRPDYAKEGTKLKIKILGTTYNATVVGEIPFVAENAALRS